MYLWKNHLPENVYTISQIREIENQALRSEIEEAQLMETAGKTAFDCFKQFYPAGIHIQVFCGVGNNGGDGFVFARYAHHAGFLVNITLVGDPTKQTPIAKQMKNLCEQANIKIQLYSEPLSISGDVIVDALLGIGLRGEVKEPYAQVIKLINASQKSVFALDCPSGLDVEHGIPLKDAVIAKQTVTFIGLKTGLLTGEGRNYAGEIYVSDLNISKLIFAEIKPLFKITSFAQHPLFFRQRPANSHKGDFGHLVIVGGDYGYAGAPILAGSAALRMGAGLVSIATRQEHLKPALSQHPELMVKGIEQAQQLEVLLQKASALVIGPGLGLSSWSFELFQYVLKHPVVKLIDADGLNILAQNPSYQTHWILTPHPGEAARLLGVTTAKIQKNRIEAANQLQKKYGGIIVLKGAGTIIKGNPETYFICSRGNPGMSSGGMGDVLSGIIGNLLAQGLDPLAAATLGVEIHGYAGDWAAKEGEKGLIASDLVAKLRHICNIHM